MVRYAAIIAALSCASCAPTMTVRQPDLDRSQPKIVNLQNYKLNKESGHWMTLSTRYNRQLEPIPDGVNADYSQLFLTYPKLVPKLRAINVLNVASSAAYLAGCLSIALWPVYADDRAHPYSSGEGVAVGVAAGGLIASSIVTRLIGSYLFGQLGDDYNRQLELDLSRH